MKFIFLILSIVCFLHALRDYFQLKGKKNLLTIRILKWNNPKYEIHSLIVSVLLGIVFMLFALATRGVRL